MKLLWAKLTRFGFMIGKNYAIDLCFLHMYNSFRDGIDFIDFEINTSWCEADHSPQFTLFFAILNFAIIDIFFYNVHHIDEKNGP